MNRIAPSSIAHYRADVDGLRAVAILLVLWFHAFPESMPGGFIGVDVFFVISGFLITGIFLRAVEKGGFSFAHFYAQRARRLLPSLMVVLPTTLAAGWQWLWPQEYTQLATHVAAAAAFVLNIQLWTEAGYFDAATELKPLMHLWSLGIEEQFYLVYPCLLWIGWLLRRNTVAVIVGVVVLSFSANVWLIGKDPSGAFFLPHARFWELALGGLLSWQQHRSRSKQAGTSAWKHYLPWLGLVSIGIGATTLHPGTPYPGAAALLPVAGSLALIFAGQQTWVNRRLLGSRPMVLIGLISYPLYLWHWPILSFARIIHTETPSTAARWAAIGLSFLLAWLTFRYVETPVRFGTRRTAKLAGVATAVCVTALSAWVLRANEGAPGRLPPDAADILAYQYDYRAGYREGTCFLRPEQTAPEFIECPDAWAPQGQSWLLWGDSHAAHLIPGLQARYGLQAGIVQRTASGCPPLKAESFPDRPHCPGIQESTWHDIETHKPARVTLAARWGFYDWHKLEHTIQRLRALGVRQIDVVGPVPQWHNGLPRQMAIAYRKNGFTALPERLASGLNPEVFTIDREMSALASRLGVAYISPASMLCNREGCVTRGMDRTHALTAWDDAHLTGVGAEFLVSRWP